MLCFARHATLANTVCCCSVLSALSTYTGRFAPPICITDKREIEKVPIWTEKHIVLHLSVGSGRVKWPVEFCSKAGQSFTYWENSNCLTDHWSIAKNMSLKIKFRKVQIIMTNCSKFKYFLYNANSSLFKIFKLWTSQIQFITN